jgi:hypothetical protein
MFENLSEFIQLLQKINSDAFIKVEYNCYDNYHPDVIECSSLANECLITSEGQPDADNIEVLRLYGFRVFPGEVDSFGWLTGCIQLSRGIIVFG